MGDFGGLVLQVLPGPDDDAGDLAELAVLLRGELLDLDVAAAEQLPEAEVQPGAKGVADIAGWLVVQLGPEALRAVLAKVADWATRSDRGVKVTMNGETLELARATREQQERIIDVWLARHPAGS